LIALAAVAAAGPAAYLALLAWVAVGGGGPAADRLRYCAVLATMHYTWGTGFLVGAARGARHSVDTSRVVSAQPSRPTP
jgi:hypothetical protein